MSQFRSVRTLARFAGISCLSLCLAGMAAAQSADSLTRAEAQPESFAAQLDIGYMADPILSIANLHDEQLAVDVLALDEDGDQHRSHRLVLEAGGTSLLGLQGEVQFERLIMSAKQAFAVEVEDALTGETLRAAGQLGSLAKNGAEFSGFSSTQCDGTWNLTCISPSGCNVVTGYKPGRVENGNQVYWNLNVPTGPWTTVGSGCSAYWYSVLSNGCPTRVVNCLNQTYRVDHDLPPEGPDLVIENITVTPGTVTSGNDVLIRYRVRNIGDTTVTQRYGERILLKPASGPAFEVFVVSDRGTDLAPNGYVDVATSPDIHAAAGTYTLQVEADVEDRVDESDENNIFNGPLLTVQAPPTGQITLMDLTYRPGSGQGWTFSMHNCPQTVSCTRTYGVKNTGNGPAFFNLQDFSDPAATVTHNCPSLMQAGATCSISINSTLPQSVARQYLGTLKVPGAEPAESSYDICITDDNTLCR